MFKFSKNIYFSFSKYIKFPSQRFCSLNQSEKSLEDPFSGQDHNSFKSRIERFKEVNDKYMDFRTFNMINTNKVKPLEKSNNNKEYEKGEQKIKSFSFALSQKLFNEEKFIEFLSLISNNPYKEELIKLKEFNDILNEVIKKLPFFNSSKNVCNLIIFAGSHNISLEENPFEIYALERCTKLSFQERIALLSAMKIGIHSTLKEIFISYEMPFLKDLRNGLLRSSDIQSLLKLYRGNNVGSINFLFTLDSAVIELSGDMRIYDLIGHLYFYSTVSYEITLDRKKEIYEALIKRVSELIDQMLPQELIQIRFSILKFGFVNENLSNNLLEQEFKCMSSFSMKQISEYLSIACLFKESDKNRVFDSFIPFIKEKVTIEDLPHIIEIFKLYKEQHKMESSLINFFENFIISKIFLLSTKEFSFALYSMLSNGIQKNEIFIKKIDEYLEQKIHKFSINDLALVIWALLKSELDVENICRKIEDNIAFRENVSLKEVTKVLWAITGFRSLYSKLFEKFANIIEKESKNADSWDLSMILWSFSRISSPRAESIIQSLESQCLDKISEFSISEFLYVLRAYSENHFGTKTLHFEFFTKIKGNIIDFSLQELAIVMHCLNCLSELYKDLPLFQELTIKIIQRIEYLKKSLKIVY